jgi:hypothetical protein
MAAFAVLVLVAWKRAGRGDDSRLAVARVIGATYVLFGTAAFVLHSFAPFFLIFIVPGAALLAAAWRTPARRPPAA